MPRVAFLGPRYSFTHEAAEALYGGDAEYLAAPSITGVFRMVERYEADYGVVPVENSLEGPVGETLDNLARTMLHISGGVELRIRLVLAASPSDNAPRRLYGHPHAVGEALDTVRRLLGGDLEVVYTPSTSHAAEQAAREGGYCLCSPRAARAHGLNVVLEDASSSDNNYTRFIVLAWRDNPQGASRTSLVAAMPDRPGALYHWLEPFAERGVNLKMIYSRPIPSKPWNYNFYVDLEGSRLDPPVAEALEEAAKRSLFLRVLGSYPVHRATS